MTKTKRQSQRFLKQIATLRKQGRTYHQIAEQLNISKSGVNQAVSALNHNCKTIGEHEDMLAKSKGYTSFSNYLCIFRTLTRQRNTLQKSFERGMEQLSLRDIANLADPREVQEPYTETGISESEKNNLYRAINSLSEVQYQAIVEHCLQEKTLDQIAKENGVTRQAVSQAKLSGLNNLRQTLSKLALPETQIKPSDRKGKTITATEDGELLLLYILSKIPSDWGKREYTTNTINYLWHDSKEVRNREFMYKPLFRKREKLDSLLRRYFPATHPSN
jgi:RNA polymerase sigma factor (sigma-70 family)